MKFNSKARLLILLAKSGNTNCELPEHSCLFVGCQCTLHALGPNHTHSMGH